MFENIKVSTRLAIGFGLVIALLVMRSAPSIVRLAEINHATAPIVKDRMPTVVLADNLRIHTIDVGRQLRSMLLGVAAVGDAAEPFDEAQFARF